MQPFCTALCFISRMNRKRFLKFHNSERGNIVKKYMSILLAAIMLTSMAGCAQTSVLTSNATGDDSAVSSTAGDSDKETSASTTATEAPYVGSDIVSNGVGGTTHKEVKSDEEYSPADGGSAGFLEGIFDGFIDEAEDAAADDYFAYADVMEAPTITAGGCVEPDIWTEPDPYIDPDYVYVEPQAGLLTGGEWNDNENWHDWISLYQSHEDWNEYREFWRISFDHRISVKVTTDNGTPVEGATVLTDEFAAVTDNNGIAYLFYDTEDTPEHVTVTYKDIEQQLDGISGDTELECSLGDLALSNEKYLDLMLMVDTTGSMSDELMYLQEELRDMVERVAEENANLPIRISVNFYRDVGDDYIVRSYPFTSDINNAVSSMMEQTAMGGGDTPEAVHTALDAAINEHEWDENAVKLMFLVLDAPPHEDAQIVDETNKLTAMAAEQGIRIIPVASSGIDKATEYLLRTMAFTTGGTYTFLTDDSGIGGSHIEPTIGDYQVEKLNDMMVRIINEYLK